MDIANKQGLMAISFLVNPVADEDLSFPWMQPPPSMSSPPSSPCSADLSSSPSGSFSYSPCPSSPSLGPVTVLPSLPPFASFVPTLPSADVSFTTSAPSSAAPSPLPSASYVTSTSSGASSTVADLLEGLLRTMGPHAFANHAAGGSGGSSSSMSPSHVTMKDSRGRGKGRRQASAGQVSLLEEVFALEPIPTALTKARLSQLLDMPTKRIQIWFKNKRARQKKGRSRKEPFTFHFFASAAASSPTTYDAVIPSVLSRFRPVKPNTSITTL